ncbi:MAG: hypothetical protein V4527_03225 [Pseudomonadota bacterium]
MKISLIGAAWLGLWFAASPVFAQAPGPSDVRAGDKTPDTAPPPPIPPASAASPDEIAHQAMVEEQERRDREEQAERDRDDQG